MPHQFGQVRVWDRPVRLLHWSFAGSMTLALASGWLGWGGVHAAAGYTAVAVLALRLVWGVCGSHYARFRHFSLSPMAALGYLRDLAHGRARRYVGHNPAASMMVAGLLSLGGLIAVSGLLTDGVINLEGPFGFLFLHVGDAGALALKHLHGALPFGLVLLVVLHVGGVLASGRQHGENLVAAMVTGVKPLVTARHRELPHDLVVPAGILENLFILPEFSDTRVEMPEAALQPVPVRARKGGSSQ